MHKVLMTFFLLFMGVAINDVRAEIIKLKSGQTIDAEILERDDEKIVVNVHDTTLTYYLDEIEQIAETDQANPDQRTVEQLHEQLKKGDVSALDALYDRASQGDAAADIVLRSFGSESGFLHPGDLSVRKAFREADPSRFIELANKGDEKALHVLMILDGYDNPSAKKGLEEIDMTDYISKAQNGDTDAFGVLAQMAFKNEQARLAILQLDMNKMMNQVDMVKDQNAMGKLAVMAMLNPDAYTGQMEGPAQQPDPEALLAEANKGNRSSLDILLGLCRDGNAAALDAVKRFDRTEEIIEMAKQGDRARFFTLLSLHSFENPDARKAFEDNDFSAILVEQLNQAQGGGVELLKALRKRGLAAQNIFDKVDIPGLVKMAHEGNGSAVSTLAAIAHENRDESIKKQIATIDFSVFVEQADQGSFAAIQLLKSLYHSLYSYDNSSIKEAFSQINPEKYVQAAREGDSSAFYSLRVLAVYRNNAALTALTELAQAGNPSAQTALKGVERDKSKMGW